MKGTRRRGLSAEQDAAIVDALRHSSKDCAENLMIVDMLRNDLGRIADIGSVKVQRLFEIEQYPTVHQMTSTVTATSGSGAGQLLQHLFSLCVDYRCAENQHDADYPRFRIRPARGLYRRYWLYGTGSARSI